MGNGFDPYRRFRQYHARGGYAETVDIIDGSHVRKIVEHCNKLLFGNVHFFSDFVKRKIHAVIIIDKDENINNDIPFLLVYEEAHKYVPKSELTKYRSSQKAIERIAKEGRKYGITLMLASQRPSEISETIFSQCNNFIAMRLTNPNDQGYVKRLLPDTLGNLIEKLPSLSAGEALLIGEAIVMPSVVRIDECKDSKPSSNDIPYWHLWKEEWKLLDFEQLRKEWHQ